MSKLTSELMTDEESGDDGSLILRHLPWRSNVINNLVSKIDTQTTATAGVCKQRVLGELSMRQPLR